jgi:hypothetical protein
MFRITILAILTVAITACRMRPPVDAYTSAKLTGLTAPSPVTTTPIVRCTGMGAPTGDRYVNAGASYEALLGAKFGAAAVSLDGTAVANACSRLSPYTVFDDTLGRDPMKEWKDSEVLRVLVGGLAEETQAGSVLVPVVVVGEVCTGTDALGRPICDWTTTEFRAFLFAGTGELLYMANAFASATDAEDMAAKVIASLPLPPT